jgi:cell wall assembly regulator SMI1
MVEFIRTAPAISEREIEAMERQLNLKLPDDLKAHYLRYNGGRPTPRFFEKDDEWYGVHQFMTMIHGDRNTGFEATYSDLVLDNPLFPDGVIPFADDEGGDYFVYSVRPESYGQILFVQSDYFEDPDRYVVFLSPSFGEFLEALAEEP